MANAAVLAVEIVADTDKATRGFASVGDSATDMAREVDKASRVADQASSRLDTVADASDNMASSSSQAAGGLGDLGGALALMPGPLGAAGAAMESVAPAIMGVTGASDLLNLATKSTIVTQTKAKAVSAAHAVQTGVLTTVTKAQTVAQRALNVVMRANPIGLVVTAVLLLVAGFVVLYKRSERFRTIVQAVGRVGRQAIGWVVDATSDLVGWIGDKLPGAANTAQRLVVGYVKLITLPIRTLFGIVKDVTSWVRSKLPGAFDKMATKAAEIGGKLLAPFQALWDLIQNILDAISKIKIPDIDRPGWLGGRAAAAGDSPAVAGGDTFNITVTGAVDPDAVASQLENMLNRRARRTGRAVVFA